MEEKEIGELDFEKEFEFGELELDIIEVFPELEALEITPTLEEQNFKPTKYGYSDITVKPIETEDLEVTPQKEEQLNIGIYRNVKVLGDENLVSENIKAGIKIFGTEGSLIPLEGQNEEIEKANALMDILTGEDILEKDENKTFKYKKLEYLNNGKIGNVIDVNFATGGKCTNFTIGFKLLEVENNKGCAFGAFYKDEYPLDGYAYYPRYNEQGSMADDNPGNTSIHEAGAIFPEIMFDTYFKYVANFADDTSTANGTFYLYDVNGDVLVSASGNGPANFYKGVSCYAFAKNFNGNITDACLMNFYECSISIDDVVVKNLIPVKRLEDGICGIYDLVSKEFYTGLDEATISEFTGPELDIYIDNEGIIKSATLAEKIEYNIDTKELMKQAMISEGIQILDTDAYRNYTDKIISYIMGLKTEIEELQNINDTLVEDKSRLQLEVNSLNTQINTLNTQVNTLNSEIEILTALSNDLQMQVTGLEVEVENTNGLADTIIGEEVWVDE